MRNIRGVIQEPHERGMNLDNSALVLSEERGDCHAPGIAQLVIYGLDRDDCPLQLEKLTGNTAVTRQQFFSLCNTEHDGLIDG